MRRPVYLDIHLINELDGQTLKVIENGKQTYIEYQFPFEKFPLLKPATIKKRLSKLVKEALKRLIDKTGGGNE